MIKQEQKPQPKFTAKSDSKKSSELLDEDLEKMSGGIGAQTAYKGRQK